MRLLLVEDDAMIGASLVHGLSDAGYEVDWVRDAVAGAAALDDPSAHYVAALVDWGLPRGDGVSLIARLRSRGDAIPVLMLTARDRLEDRVRGLDAGADDYLVKPFELQELLARIRSLLRRPPRRAGNAVTVGSLTLDPVSHEAHVEGRRVALSAREFALLYALMDAPGAVLSRTQLEDRLYGFDDPVESNAVEVVIHAVRRKLGRAVVENVRGVGWRLGTPS
ncbi:MAG: response regulator transcription factor [Gammaproteobacteria bacterium]|nr:response regulator transcription factor [Gammaproteobacteria bacterium]